MVNRVKQEVSIHSRLKHPSVLELYTCFEDDYQVYLVLELCHNGELQSYMRTKKSTFSEEEGNVGSFNIHIFIFQIYSMNSFNQSHESFVILF